MMSCFMTVLYSIGGARQQRNPHAIDDGDDSPAFAVASAASSPSPLESVGYIRARSRRFFPPVDIRCEHTRQKSICRCSLPPKHDVCLTFGLTSVLFLPRGGQILDLSIPPPLTAFPPGGTWNPTG